jgi:hypothetical protein
MQYAKDSFYMALRTRLMAINPQRTVVLNGVTRPAVIVAENEPVIPVEPVADAFYLEWGGARLAGAQQIGRPFMAMDCTISYHTLGESESGVDRGRTLGELDQELLEISQPRRTGKRDYTQVPSADLGTDLFWSWPELGEVAGSEGIGMLPEKGQGARLERRARIRIFFFPEVNEL